jgi:hypothetical protein
MTILSAKHAIWVFWSWIFLNVILWVVSLLDGSLFESMGHAVDYASAAGSETDMDRKHQFGLLLSSVQFIS